MSSDPGGAPGPRRHLMVPGQPRPPQRGDMSLSSVQRWVLSTLAATTILHLSVGLVLAAAYAEETTSQVGLLVIAAAFGALAVEAALLIHRHHPVSAWLLLGPVPSLVGAWVIFV